MIEDKKNILYSQLMCPDKAISQWLGLNINQQLLGIQCLSLGLFYRATSEVLFPQQQFQGFYFISFLFFSLLFLFFYYYFFGSLIQHVSVSLTKYRIGIKLLLYSNLEARNETISNPNSWPTKLQHIEWVSYIKYSSFKRKAIKWHISEVARFQVCFICCLTWQDV